MLLALLALGAWMACAFLAQSAAALSTGAAVRWTGEGQGVSPDQMSRALRYAREDGAEDIPALTLWREQAGQTAQAGERSGAARVLELCGSGADLWPASFLAGYYPIPGDTGGCAVDRALAEALWGTGRAVGNELELDGRKLTVRGVFEGGDGLLLVQGETDSAQPYPNLFLKFSGGDAKAQAEGFLTRNQWSGGTLLDLPILSWLLESLAALPAVCLGAGILVRLLRRGLDMTAAPLLLAGYALPALAGAGVTLWAMGLPGIPGQLIPTRWSDFDFWARLVSDRAGELTDYLTLAPGVRDLRYWPLALGCVALAMAACALTVLAAERSRAETGRELLLGWGLCVGGTFAWALAFAGNGGVAVGRSMWLLPLLWLACDWCLERHRESLKPRGGETDEAVEEDAASL